VHRNAVAFLVTFSVALVLVSFPAASSGAPSTASRYHRIISLSPTITEDLFAIGAGKQVVAVDSQSNYPASAPQTSLSGYTPNVEAIAGYHPDLVFISYNPNHFADQLRHLGIRVVMEPGATNLKQAYSEITSVGLLTGHQDRANLLVRSMKYRLSEIVAGVPGVRRHLRLYHELDPTYYSATSRTFIGSVYRLFGFANIANAAGASAGTDYPQLSGEYIVKRNPQIIVLADSKCCGQTAGTVAARSGWKGIAAVQHGRVIGIDDDIASRWGPRIVQFAAAVAKIARHN